MPATIHLGHWGHWGHWPTRVAAGSAVFTVALGLTVLAGWSSHTPALIQLLPHLPPMTRNAAACFVLCGLLVPGRPRKPKVARRRVRGNGQLATSMGFALGSSEAFGWGGLTRLALHTAVGFWMLGVGMVALAWHLEADSTGSPRWLPISVAMGVATAAVGLWQALIAGGQSPFALLPAVTLAGGCVLATIFGLTVHLAQRAHRENAQRGDAERRTNLALEAGQMGTYELDLATDHVGAIAQA